MSKLLAVETAAILRFFSEVFPSLAGHEEAYVTGLKTHHAGLDVALSRTGAIFDCDEDVGNYVGQ